MKTTGQMLKQIDDAHTRLWVAFGLDGPEQLGPCTSIIVGIHQAIVEFSQGSNQAASEEEEDTIWTREELEVFTDALPHMMAVVEAAIKSHNSWGSDLIPTLPKEV